MANCVVWGYGITSQLIEDYFKIDEERVPPDICPEEVLISKDFLTSVQHEADLLKHRFSGTEHLLLAIARRNEKPIADFLKSCSVSPQYLIRETYDILGHGLS